MVELPAIDAVVCLHHGSYEHAVVGPIYGEMHRYAEDNGMQASGPGRDHFMAVDGNSAVLELQLPVRRD